MNTGSPLPKPSDTRQVPEAENDKVTKDDCKNKLCLHVGKRDSNDGVVWMAEA